MARRKAALVIEMIQGKATVAEASRSFNLTPSEIEGWKEVAKRAMQNSLRAKPLDNREQFATQFKGLQEGLQADGSAVSIATRTSTVACASACRPAK
ncbi:DUF1153 domain-containing protein [Pseudotabrizicola sp. 4114]|uniref:DUF1153 domain-containing protein n=1 Tax=Pseudotabrizicola sp. 4114 TaxID=2817731 RepID=UPI0032B7D08D